MHSECVPLLDQCPCSALFDEGKIQQSFLKVFTALLKNYRQYLSVPEVYRHALREKELRNEAMGISSSHRSLLNLGEIAILPEDWFRKEEFLASGIDREARPFMTVLAATQSFAQFTLDRMERPGDDYEVLFFNEMLSAKRNRSLLRFSKTDTPFLNDESFRASQTVACMDPDVADLGLGTEQPNGPPRPPPSSRSRISAAG
ncbi:hypothetical protein CAUPRSCDRAFT_12968 [Caulochytrium protostelioides]|uniref:dDENN domain-containing protein n=1 Tax=Caulochytrium protostelioides TaxID=1555241 RepID=A0A4P9WVW9_9FUNG|nr:hypothetical protein CAUPRSCDRAFT_12968 [Caulochytrium protostelioides]